MAEIQYHGLDAAMGRLDRLVDPDPTDLLLRWREVMEEDNRRGIMGGLDGFGRPMTPVKYRLALASALPQFRAGRSVPKRFRKAPKLPDRSRLFVDFGGLARSEYRRLSGPPLAPRGEGSRVISNYATAHGEEAAGRWFAEGAWIDVVSDRGVPFLHSHFVGAGHDPTRDLRGIRPWGRAAIDRATRSWVGSELLGQASHFQPLGHFQAI
ncbi:MAG TPA: hypothetical protein VG406_23455 [Isosphaeraceae bacterium]|nr:hypothetical protein [Isosphaeraceae bacterium]